MNFFEHQDQARRYTRRLLLLFALAVISLITITTLFVAVLLWFSDAYTGQAGSHISSGGPLLWQLLNTKLALSVAAVVLTVVAMGSLYKWIQLSGGGERVAASLGGRRLQPSSEEPSERQLLNVVEEMAIASGTPVPPVYLLEESGINAFAAGDSIDDAVIGVTRGCMELLSRDELQGVIAHEFSHILHGDMRINLRLIGVLHGILVIGLIGSMLMRGGFYSSGYNRRNNRDNGGIVMLGLGLVVIGYCGTFFGKLIKSAVSRQREFLADASAVQYTRNPPGISGALQKIGGYSQGALIHRANAEEFSHMFFGDGLSTAFGGWLATHPPLEERIRRVTPEWNGRFPLIQRSTRGTVPSMADHKGAPVAAMAPAAAATITTAATDASLQHMGQPTPEHLAHAAQLIAAIPLNLQQAAREPFAARALIYNLLIQPEHQQAQWQRLQERAHPAVFKLARELHTSVTSLPQQQRLPLVELAMPALKQLSPTQYQVFRDNVIALIKTDSRVDVFEWALYRLLMNALQPRSAATDGTVKLRHLAVPCQQLLSTLATAGHDTEAAGLGAYRQAMAELGFANLPLLGDGQLSLPMLDSAIQQLQQLHPLQKPTLLKAMLTCIRHDGQIAPQEYELFRAVADCLHCPIPPLL
ncbi:M48 family metallopeptidase [Pseudomaricurvus sp. HS19]|uniref:M48 family metallopeptidase n=1 Tax=Pseudomaricurvus sp. HS19 TaxID=2692626 RepID=UPI001371E4BD|nr:M48 family metallopeptidase [Pseudomaricurvus sp. HS19]MYM63127.1 M48 family metalloprotease [Pseudomaricurvus sp. HS19]